MTSLLYDEIDMDAEEWGDEEDFDSYGDEASDRDTRRRRAQARQRRVDLARRRQAQSRARRTSPVRRPSAPAGAQRATESAIRTLDLENKVAQDTFRSASTESDKRMSRAEYSAVATAAVAQFIETFDQPQNDIAKAALRFAPLLLLAPKKKGTGIESYIRDPRVLGLAAVGTIVLIGEVRKKGGNGNEIRISGPAQLTVGNAPVTFFADVLDGNGNEVSDVTVTWEIAPTTVATIDRTSGPTTTVTAVSAGNATITARADKLVQRFQLTVAPGYGGSKGVEDDTAPKPAGRAGAK